MGTTSDFARFTEVDNLTQDWLFNVTAGVADAISVGDLVYDAGSDVARPADKLTSLTTEALDQAQFAQKFVGVSQEKILAAETNTTKRYTVRVDGVMDFNCASNTFNKGDLIGVYSDGSTLDPQKVDKVTHPALAIGVVVKYYGSATTRVRARIVSRKTWDLSSDWAAVPKLFDGQKVATTNALSDGNQTLTVASALFQSMVPTAARSVTLPDETRSKGLAFVIWNNSGGANTITMKKSGGTDVDGTAGIPQGKIGVALCDGTTWYGIVSA